MEKTHIKKNKSPLIPVSGVELDRDKNDTYIPNDESVTEVIDPVGVPKFIHPNHETPKTEKT